ncbi:MAG: hypothetical protein WAW88_15460 [Nocardioides sp.]
MTAAQVTCEEKWNVRAFRVLAPMMALVVLATGCAGARPGVAAQIGQQVITMRSVNAMSADLCAVFLPQIKEQGQSFPLRVIRNIAVKALVDRRIAEKVAAAYDVQPGSTYTRQLAAQQQTALALEPELRDNYLYLATAQSYVEAIQEAIGAASLRADGVAAPTLADQVARGREVIATWADDNGVVVDPRFGFTVIDGQLAPQDNSVTTAVSAEAVAGTVEQMDPADVAKLPASLRCG